MITHGQPYLNLSKWPACKFLVLPSLKKNKLVLNLGQDRPCMQAVVWPACESPLHWKCPPVTGIMHHPEPQRNRSGFQRLAHPVAETAVLPPRFLRVGELEEFCQIASQNKGKLKRSPTFLSILSRTDAKNGVFLAKNVVLPFTLLVIFNSVLHPIAALFLSPRKHVETFCVFSVSMWVSRT